MNIFEQQGPQQRGSGRELQGFDDRLWVRYDSKGGSELNERVSEKIERKVARRSASKSIQARESVLGKLHVEIRVSEDRATKEHISMDMSKEGFVIEDGIS